MRRLLKLVVFTLTLSMLVACQTDDPADPEEDYPSLAADLLPYVRTAVDMLVASGGSADTLRVIRAEHVTWPDGARGCPQPGMMYTQALLDGYRIVIATPDGDEFFHGATNDAPTRCDNPHEPVG